MAIEETRISQRCDMEACKNGATMFRNNTGMFITQKGDKVMAGLGKGTSDLIGWREVEITPDMVGKKIAVFTALEVKTKIGRASAQQIKFIDNVNRSGGIAGIVRHEDDVKELFDAV